MAATCPGMSRPCATISPRASNSAQEKSCASAITGKWAVPKMVWSISRTMGMNLR